MAWLLASGSVMNKPRRNAIARAVFFARRDQIRTALESGNYLSEVFRAISYPGSYSQFARYVARYIGPSQPQATEPAKPPPVSSWSPAPRASSAAPRRSERPTRQVKYDPNQLNREDVI